MTYLRVTLFAFGLIVLPAACDSSATDPTQAPTQTPAPVSNSLCGRQRDNDLRCNPTRIACLRQDSYAQCKATEPLYGPELTTMYLNCYPPTLACDSSSTSAARRCALTAADRLPVSAALMLFVGNVCQRCPGVANDQVTEPTICTTNLTTNTTNLALTLRYYTDETLDQLNTCLVKASPPADGCIAFESCYKQLVPPAPASSCTSAGGA